MKLKAVSAIALLLALGMASAGEAERKIKIDVVKKGDDGNKEIHWVGEGIDLDGIAVGESKTLEDGVVVTRSEDGLSFQIDGETIDMPNHGTHARHVNHMVLRGSPTEDSTVIVSASEIDETTQETIRSVLASAGYDANVRFVDRSSEKHHVRLVERHVEEKIVKPD